MALARANYAMGRMAQSFLAYNMAILISPGLKNLKEFDNAITGRMNLGSPVISLSVSYRDMITVNGIISLPCFRRSLPLRMILSIP